MMSKPTPRIIRLRNQAQRRDLPGRRSPEGELHYRQGFEEHAKAPSWLVRRAQAKQALLANATPVIDADELIVGKPCYRVLAEAEARWLQAAKERAHLQPKLGGQSSHMAVDYPKLLRLGITGIQEEIADHLCNLDPQHPSFTAKEQFYQSCMIALAGVLQYAENYAAEAERLAAAASDPQRAQELSTIASTLRRVPAYPATTFPEALQSVHFVTFCLEGLYQWGRPDRYLLEFYRRDLVQGRLTPETAQEWIDAACLMFNEYIPRGLAVGLMVGGSDANGEPVYNELSQAFLTSIRHTRTIYPGIGLCWVEGMPTEALELALECLAEGLSHPAIFNDHVIRRGLEHYGVPRPDSHAYIHSTCVEITPIATSGVWVASPYINLAALLLEVLDTAPAPESFAAFLQLLRQRIRQEMAVQTQNQNRLQHERFHHGGDALVSCLVHDCLEQGRDIDQGGARYNWIMPSFVGLANLVDSLFTIQTLVYDQKRLTLADLQQLLSSPDCAETATWRFICQRLDKYGCDEEQVDSLARCVTDWLRQDLQEFTTFHGDPFIPSMFCWIMHEKLGRSTPATPDGRPAAFPLGDGSGPAQGRERKGPTAALRSATQWEHWPFIGGIAVNLKLGQKLFSQTSRQAVLALAQTYLERGGFELQINVVDRDTLLKAQTNPEQYGDLIVRIGGYSDYFVRLSKDMQAEILARTEHNL